MSERTTTIDVTGGKMHLTERKLKHPQTGKMANYVSFSNGMDVSGVYLNDKAKKEIAKWLTSKGEETNG